ncbi:hypothetical protein RRG08_006096 [Elysia crispata]|uniref:Uncharacterized protein n=1 Tax=Elysia crispata TaxID=231223 RepID=A0AAE1AAW6_9GAST|nr:hypothetical protein RRG08_006096 [Elysia crispata]
MAEASGSSEAGPSHRQRRSNPEMAAEGEIEHSMPCTSSHVGAAGCSCPQSPTPSSRLPESHFFRNSPQPQACGKVAGKSKKNKLKKTMMKINKLPRYLWAAFGRVRGPLKRHLKRRKCGQSAKRAYPWSKARCVACLFNVQWFETAAGQDEVSKMMRTVRSPRPNRTSRSQTARGAAASQPADESNDDRHKLPGPSKGRRRLFPDIAEECPRRLSDILEEEEEEKEYVAAEREFVHHYSAALPDNSEFELVDREKDKEGEVKRVGEKRKAETQTVSKSLATDQQASKDDDPDYDDDDDDDEEEPVFSRPVKRRLF